MKNEYLKPASIGVSRLVAMYTLGFFCNVDAGTSGTVAKPTEDAIVVVAGEVREDDKYGSNIRNRQDGTNPGKDDSAKKLVTEKLNTTIADRVKRIVAEQLGVKESDVHPYSRFVDDLGADSLDTVELVMAVEGEFQVEIIDEDAAKITTVQQAIQYLESHIP